jgi:hypothetical protein
MKNIVLSFLLILSFSLFSQQKPVLSIAVDKDLLIRKSLSCQYLTENQYEYVTADGKAMHNLLLEAFKLHGEIINVDVNAITNIKDKANLQSFIGGLNSILLLTPSWNDLLTFEKNRILLEDKALRRKPYYSENQ